MLKKRRPRWLANRRIAFNRRKLKGEKQKTCQKRIKSQNDNEQINQCDFTLDYDIPALRTSAHAAIVMYSFHEIFFHHTNRSVARSSSLNHFPVRVKSRNKLEFEVSVVIQSGMCRVETTCIHDHQLKRKSDVPV